MDCNFSINRIWLFFFVVASLVVTISFLLLVKQLFFFVVFVVKALKSHLLLVLVAHFLPGDGLDLVLVEGPVEEDSDGWAVPESLELEILIEHQHAGERDTDEPVGNCGGPPDLPDLAQGVDGARSVGLHAIKEDEDA